MATSSTKPEASHALDHDLLKTLNLVTPKTTGKALTEAWEGGSGLSCSSSAEPERASPTPARPPAGGRVRDSPRGPPAPSGRHPGDGTQPARAASQEAQGQGEARSHRGPEQPPRGSQQGCHGSACPRQAARSCRGPGGARDDGVAPRGTDQVEGGIEMGQGAHEGKAELPGARESLLCFIMTYLLCSILKVPISTSLVPSILSELGQIPPLLCSW